MIEIVSPGNKERRIRFAAFVRKAEQALLSGIHLLIVDLFPPTAATPMASIGRSGAGKATGISRCRTTSP